VHRPQLEKGLVPWRTLKRPLRSNRSAARLRRPKDQRATLVGLGLNKMHRRSTLEGHAGSARHDPEGSASRPRRRRRVRDAGRKMMKLNELGQRVPRKTACASAAASVPARARPAAVASRVRSPVRASRSRASKAARCRSPPPAEARLHEHLRQGLQHVSLGRVQIAIDAGKLDASQTVDGRGAQGRRRHPPGQGRRPPARRR
jgi:hypothetical protein